MNYLILVPLLYKSHTNSSNLFVCPLFLKTETYDFQHVLTLVKKF